MFFSKNRYNNRAGSTIPHLPLNFKPIMVIDGKKLASHKLAKIKQMLKKTEGNIQLDILYIEYNAASELFIKKKLEVAKELNIKANLHTFQKSVLEEVVLTTCNHLNNNPNTTGYFIQLPISEELDSQKLLNNISLAKDVDCLSHAGIGLAIKNPEDSLKPATVEAIATILIELKVPLKSKHVVIVNDSNLIGKPLAAYCLAKGATVTICNEYTKKLSSFTQCADILVSAVGKSKLITEDMVNEKCIIIDAGISKSGTKAVGDVDYSKVVKKVKTITPVPGGVGPLTVACLFENLLKLYEKTQ